MVIRAVIFDLGGVLIDMNVHQYDADKQRGIKRNIFDYEQINVKLAQFVVSMRPLYKTATICNGGSREAANRKFHLDEFIDVMVFDSEEGISKPDIRIYQRTLTKLAVRPAETIFVDDKERNIEAARQIGMSVVLFRNTAQAIADIQTLLNAEPSSAMFP